MLWRKRRRKESSEGQRGKLSNYEPNRPLAGYAILIVEDEALTRQTFCDWLRAAGAEVQGASDAYEAFEKTAQRMPDLIVLDIVLPGMTGFQLVHEWAKRGRLCKVMAISGERTAAQDGLEAGKLGITKYLSKPLRQEDLVQGVHESVLFGDPINSLKSEARAEDEALLELARLISQTRKLPEVDYKVAGKLGEMERQILKDKPDQTARTKIMRSLGEISEAIAKKAGPDIILEIIKRLGSVWSTLPRSSWHRTRGTGAAVRQYASDLNCSRTSRISIARRQTLCGARRLTLRR